MCSQAIAEGSSLFNHLRNEWTFDQGPTPGSCWLGFSVDFSFRSALYAHASSLFFDEVVTQMVSAFQDRCQVVCTLHHQLAAASRDGTSSVPADPREKAVIGLPRPSRAPALRHEPDRFSLW